MDHRLRIATFNLENLDDGPSVEPPLDDRIAILRPQLLRLDADVLCLQEVNGQHAAPGAPRTLGALDRLIAGTAYAGFHRAATKRGDGAYDVHNLVVLSRYPIAAIRQIHHDHVPAPQWTYVTGQGPEAGRGAVMLRWNRPLLHVEIALPDGRRLHVVNLHLKSPSAAFVPGQKAGAWEWRTASGWAEGMFLAEVRRGGQALEARLVVDRLFDADGGALVAVCGDFNADARQAPVRILMAAEEDTGAGRLAGRVLIALERGVPEGQRYSVVHHGRPQMLDHLLISRALLTHYRHAEIHNEGLGDELVAYAAVHAPPDSFHAPVVAEFHLTAP